jgi:hypothetical protein
MSLLPNLDEMTDNEKMAVLESIQKSISQSKEIQKQKIAANVDLVVQALKKIETDIRSRFDDVGNAIEKRVSTIKDGRDGINGKDGRDGKDGKNGRDGAKGDRGERGQDGRDGVDGVDGVSVSNARIDFDGSLIITLSTGVELNVGEVVAPDLAESIKVITNGGGTSQYVLDTLASLQTQIDNLIPSQTGNAGKFLTTDGTDISWASVAGGLSYQGTWNATTNTPTLTSSVGVNGYYYIVSTAGSTNLDGITDWQIGDWLLFNGSVWQKIDQSNLVTSVNGQTGAVSVGTVTSVAATAGTGITVTGSPITSSGTLTITNSAPDQTVSLTGAGTTSISGTYPNFTITSADSTVGTVTSVGGTGTVSGISLSGTVTSSGNLTLGGSLDLSSPPTIGNTTPNTGTFTTLTVNDNVTLGSSNSDTVTFTGRISSDFDPATDNAYDLGRVGHEWRDLYIDGTANIDSLIADTADINAGTIDGTTIGASSASTGAFTTLSATGVTTVQAGTVSTPAITTSGDTNTGIFFPAADTIAFSEGGAEAMRIDSSGNVGIGTSSPAGKLDVSQSTAGVARHYLRNTSNSVGAYTILDLVNDSGNNIGEFFCTSSTNTSSFGTNATVLQAATSNPLILGTNGTERARIDSSGNLRINNTNTSLWVGTEVLTSFGFSLFKHSSTPALVWNTSASGELIAFSAANRTDTGNISTNGTTTAYNTTSDYRLKENVAPMQNALATVALLKPCTYKWKSSGSSSQGFIAHELQEVVPDCVNGEKDAVEIYIDKDGNEHTRPKYQSIDTSFLVATLTAAIQEQQALILSLTDRITALEAK